MDTEKPPVDGTNNFSEQIHESACFGRDVCMCWCVKGMSNVKCMAETEDWMPLEVYVYVHGHIQT